MKTWYGLLVAWISLAVFGEEDLLTHHRRIWKEMASLHGQNDPESKRRKDELRAELARLRDLAVSPNVAGDGLEVLQATLIDRAGREVEFPMRAGFEGAEYVLIPMAQGSESGARYAGAHFAEAMEDFLAHNELARGRLRYVDPDDQRIVTALTYDRVDRFFDGLGVATGIAGVALIAAALAPTALTTSVGSLVTFGLVTGLASLGIQIKLNADRAMGGKQVDWTGLSFAAAGTALMGLGRFASTVGTRLGVLAAGFGLDGAELTHGVRLAREVYREEAPRLNPDQRMKLAAQLVIQSIVDGVTRVLLNGRFLVQTGRDLLDSIRPLAPELAYATGSPPRQLDWNRSLQNSETGADGPGPAPKEREPFFRFERKIGWPELIAAPSLLLSALSMFLHYWGLAPRVKNYTDFEDAEVMGRFFDPRVRRYRFVAFVPAVFSNTGGSPTAIRRLSPHREIPPLEIVRKGPDGEKILDPTPQYELFIAPSVPDSKGEIMALLSRRKSYDPAESSRLDLKLNVPVGEIQTFYIGIVADAYDDVEADEVRFRLDADFVHGFSEPIEGRIPVPPAPAEEE